MQSRLLKRLGGGNAVVETHDTDEHLIRSREKSDIWHEYDNLSKLLKKDCPASSAICRLLRVATITVNEVDEKKLHKVLASKGVGDFEDHFFFNREYWYRRVRFPPRKGSKASSYLLGALSYMKENEVLKEYITPEVEKFSLDGHSGAEMVAMMIYLM